MSLKGVKQEADERIFAFSIDVIGSGSQALRWTHRNWSISSVSLNKAAAGTSSTPQATARLRGATLDPATAVLPEDFSNFLTLGTRSETAPPPRLQGELVLRKMTDPTLPPRRLSLTEEQFQLQPLP